jgi:multicomponent Na+:H+ antiporter subunit C
MCKAETLSPAAANPLPQALVLTAIVIGFALLCFALVLIANLARHDVRQDGDALRASEPDATDPIKPPVMES